MSHSGAPAPRIVTHRALTAHDQLVVVGAGVAGLRTAEAARRAGFTGRLVLVGDEPHAPYNRPPLSKAVLEGTVLPCELQLTTAQALDELGVDLRLAHRAVELDLRAGRVRVESSLGVRPDEDLPYDALVVATGSRPRTLPADIQSNQGLGGVHVLRTVDDAQAVRRDLADARSVVVIGAGFIGAEVASCAARAGARVTVVEQETSPLQRAVGTVAGELCGRLHARAGVGLRCGVRVIEVRGDAAVREVRLDDGSTLAADLVIVGIGSAPNVEWLHSSGLDVSDGLVCDETLASAPGIWGAGDAVSSLHPVLERRLRLQSWTAAAEQAAVAAHNAVHADRRPARVIPYFWSDQYGARVQGLGTPSADQVVLFGSPEDLRFFALHRDGESFSMVVAVDRPDVVMKFRPLLATRSPWDDAVALAKRLLAA